MKRGGNPDEFKDTGFFKAREITPISVRNERMALKKLVSVCLSTLVNYSTSYKEDLELLEKDKKDHHLSVNERNCVKLRSGEKRILHYMIDNAQLLIPLLEDDMTLKKARDVVSKYENFACQLYCDVAIFPLLKEKEGTGMSNDIEHQVKYKMNQANPQKYV